MSDLPSTNNESMINNNHPTPKLEKTLDYLSQRKSERIFTRQHTYNQDIKVFSKSNSDISNNTSLEITSNDIDCNQAEHAQYKDTEVEVDLNTNNKGNNIIIHRNEPQEHTIVVKKNIQPNLC